VLLHPTVTGQCNMTANCRLKALVLTVVVHSAWGEEPRPLERPCEPIVAWLRTQEQLVETMYCEFTDIELPTDADVYGLISEINRQRGAPHEDGNYMLQTDRRTKVRWWRKNGMERFENVIRDNRTSKSEHNITVYDGNYIWAIWTGGTRGTGSRKGQINSGEFWNNINRIDGYSIVYDFYKTPYSELLVRSPRTICREVDNGKWHVSFQQPNSRHMRIDLFFGTDRNLQERRLFHKLGYDIDQRQYESHEFHDYRTFPHASGETIYFPTRVIYKYFLGYTSDGPLAEYKRRIVTFDKILFNTPISDKVFELQFPRGTHVSDERAGFDQTVEWVETGGSGLVIWRRALILLAGVLLLSLVVWWRVRLRR
jgi:hypothetical protein